MATGAFLLKLHYFQNDGQSGLSLPGTLPGHFPATARRVNNPRTREIDKHYAICLEGEILSPRHSPRNGVVRLVPTLVEKVQQTPRPYLMRNNKRFCVRERV